MSNLGGAACSLLVLGLLAAACGSSEDSSGGTSGGSAGAATGGSGGTSTGGGGGVSSGGTSSGGSGGASTGGSGGASTGGNAGAPTGGSSGANSQAVCPGSEPNQDDSCSDPGLVCCYADAPANPWRCVPNSVDGGAPYRWVTLNARECCPANAPDEGDTCNSPGDLDCCYPSGGFTCNRQSDPDQWATTTCN